MTTPYQRTRSVLQTKAFLSKLVADNGLEVPRQVQDEARRLLYHYPEPWHLLRLHKQIPEDWGPVAGPDDEVVVSAERLEALALDAIWSGTQWLSAKEIVERAPSSSPVSTALVAQWEAEGRLFGVERSGQKVYPSYAFDTDFSPRPVIKAVLDTLPYRSSLGVALFFESTSSFLAGLRAREILASDPERVIAQARDEHEWLEVGG